jgi:signal transduction histidine kinase
MAPGATGVEQATHDPLSRGGSTRDPLVEAEHVRVVAHDLRHHVATIGALAEAIAMTAKIPPAGEALLSSLRREIIATRELCEHLTQRPATAIRLRADRITRQVIEEQRPAMGCEVQLEIEPAELHAPPLHIRRLLENLLRNACDAAGPDGLIVVSVTQDADDVIVEVSDSGPGFPEAGNEGVGLGLRIVHQLVTELGGRVLIDISRFGGATVRATLPSTRPARWVGGETR